MVNSDGHSDDTLLMCPEMRRQDLRKKNKRDREQRKRTEFNTDTESQSPVATAGHAQLQGL